MKYYAILIMVVMMMVFPLKDLFAKMPMPLQNVAIRGHVGNNKDYLLYSFNYSVFNPFGNELSVDGFNVDISTDVEAASSYAEGLFISKGKNVDGELITRGFRDEYDEMKPLMRKLVVPVGIMPPEGYFSGLTVRGEAMWGVDSESSLIAPGQLKNGFVLYSMGLPGIRVVSVIPNYLFSEEDIFAMGISEDEFINNERAVLERVYKSISFTTKTIGPVIPPAELKPADFIDNIINMKHEAFALGWITDKAIEHSLDVKLDNAKKKIAQGNLNAAIQILKAFINEVEAQGCESYDQKCPPGKHLKPEAYAILKYNAQYLVDNMK